jgi:hypothetical protein
MDRFEFTGKYAALLSGIEIGLGSLLHSFRVPFSGQFLSLNQGLILSRACHKSRGEKWSSRTPSGISNVSAVLKSLSPAGKKLTPMLAIAAQGNLFALGVILFGNNFMGLSFGMFLLSLWAFIQPLMIYLLLFGKNLLFMADYFIDKISKVTPVHEETLIGILVSIIAIKIILGQLVVIASYYLSDQKFKMYETKLLRTKVESSRKNLTPLRGAIKDLMNPLFLVSLILLALFFFFSNSSASTTIWGLLRPLAGGFILFYLVRVMPMEGLSQKLKEGKFKNTGRALEKAILYLKQI